MKKSALVLFTILGSILFLFPQKVEAFQDGTGTSEDPYVITTCAHLQDIQTYPTAYFVLGSDIDCTETSTWNQEGDEYRGFNPIGGGSDFWGVLDGMYYTVRNLYINRPSENSVGLFRTVEGGIVGSLNFDGANITGSDKVGVLSGDAEGGEFYDIQITDSVVVAEGLDEVGGLLGYGVETIIEGCSFDGTVTGGNRVGGLVGYEEVSMDMSDSYNLGIVNGYIRVGGLIGSVEGTLSMTDSYNKGNIISAPDEVFASYEGVGGLVGSAWQPIILRSYNEGDISTSGGELYVGGLVGGGGLVNIQQSYNTGTISVSSASSGDYNGTGGLLGSGINVTILDSYNWGDINQDLITGLTEAPPIGGILGFAFVSSIKNSYNQGVLTLDDDTDNPSSVGGIAGKLFFDDLLFSYVLDDTGKTFLQKVGEYVFELINNFNVGDLFGRSNSWIGGLIGSVLYNYGNFDEEFILLNNWWSNNIAKAIGYIRDEGEMEEILVENEEEGLFEKESIVEGFKTYSHKVYDTDPEWDFAEIWSNAYEGRGYPVLGFQSILAPGKPIASVTPGTYGSPFTLVLSSNGNSIRYTINGVLPTCSVGLLYVSPLQISSSTVVKAVACDEFNLASVLGEYSYIISVGGDEVDDSTPPVVNLVNRYFDVVPEVEEESEEEENDSVDDIAKLVSVEDDEKSVNKKFNWWWLIVVFVLSTGYIVIRRLRRKS